MTMATINLLLGIVGVFFTLGVALGRWSMCGMVCACKASGVA